VLSNRLFACSHLCCVEAEEQYYDATWTDATQCIEYSQSEIAQVHLQTTTPTKHKLQNKAIIYSRHPDVQATMCTCKSVSLSKIWLQYVQQFTCIAVCYILSAYEYITSSTELGIHNVSQRCQTRKEATSCTENLKFGYSFWDMWADMQTNRQKKDIPITILSTALEHEIINHNIQPTKLITSSIVRGANCRYLSYWEGDFEVFFASQGRYVAPVGGEIWFGGVDQRSTPLCQILPHQCSDKIIFVYYADDKPQLQTWIKVEIKIINTMSVTFWSQN